MSLDEDSDKKIFTVVIQVVDKTDNVAYETKFQSNELSLSKMLSDSISEENSDTTIQIKEQIQVVENDILISNRINPEGLKNCLQWLEWAKNKKDFVIPDPRKELTRSFRDQWKSVLPMPEDRETFYEFHKKWAQDAELLHDVINASFYLCIDILEKSTTCKLVDKFRTTDKSKCVYSLIPEHLMKYANIMQK